MNIILNDVETRVLGSLVEKDVTTPDYYPLSLNALVNACNQKNNRDPVMNLDEDVVRQALDALHAKNLVGPASGADSRVTKYEHRLQEAFQLQPRRDGDPVRAVAARSANTRRASWANRAHAALRGSRRSAIHSAAPDAAPTTTGQSATPPAGHQGSALHAPALRGHRGRQRGKGSLARDCQQPSRHQAARALGRRSPGTSQRSRESEAAASEFPQAIRVRSSRTDWRNVALAHRSRSGGGYDRHVALRGL